MKTGGIDIGSRFTKYVVMNSDLSFASYKRETGHEPLKVCRELIERNNPDRLIATGYGRHLLEVYDNVTTITEIKAVARGAREIFPTCRTIIDIGGQDTKVVSLNDSGMVINFEMNDRCAAGTGKFFEVMAQTLGFDLDTFGKQCVKGSGCDIQINSMCTVFAESEVISLINRGENRKNIASALHNSIVKRVIALASRVGVENDVVFAGGCAKNSCLKSLFEERLQIHISVSEKPDMLSALGAAFYAREKREK